MKVALCVVMTVLVGCGELVANVETVEVAKTGQTGGTGETGPTPPTVPETGGPSTPSDPTPPSKPGDFQVTSATRTSVWTSFSPSTDNLGVTGYRLYAGGALAGSTRGTQFTFYALSCDTEVTLAVEATDAAGNASPRATVVAKTAPCSATPDHAHLWVDLNGGSCTRAAVPAAYADEAACGSFAAAYATALGGDRIRVKAGSYPAGQSAGGAKTPVVHLVGEDGTVVVSGRPTGAAGNLSGLALGGNITVSNVNVGGHEPFIFLGGVNSTWRDSRLLEASNDDSLARGSQPGQTPEPILIYTEDENPTIRNVSLINIVVEPQYVCTPGLGSCKQGDVYHLESIRIDQNVNGVLIDQVTFLSGGEDNTALIYITSPGPAATKPENVTIRNSVFGNHTGSYNVMGGFVGNKPCVGFTFAYNTSVKEWTMSCPSVGSSVQWIGNVGPKSPVACVPGATYIKNVWQWSSNVANCAGNNDHWVEGDNYSVNALGLDANLRPMAGSAVIDRGENTYCTGALASVDRDGAARPVGATCDAGAFERH